MTIDGFVLLMEIITCSLFKFIWIFPLIMGFLSESDDGLGLNLLIELSIPNLGPGFQPQYSVSSIPYFSSCYNANLV